MAEIHQAPHESHTGFGGYDLLASGVFEILNNLDW